MVIIRIQPNSTEFTLGKCLISDTLLDCHVWKYPRTDAADKYDSIPPNVKLNFLTDGQEFSVDGANVKIVHTPGHTTDHIVVVSKEDGALFSGDCILGLFDVTQPWVILNIEY